MSVELNSVRGELSTVGSEHSVDALRIALNKVVSAMLDAVDLSEIDEQDGNTLTVDRANAIGQQLTELSSAFHIAEGKGASLLLKHLRIAIERCAMVGRSLTLQERGALIECCYILPRYLDFVAERDWVEEQPLLLSKYFHLLAMVRLAPFVTESSLSDFEFSANSTPRDVELNADITTIRRMRKMYQLGLIGLLRKQDIDNQFNIIEHVAERIMPMLQASTSENQLPVIDANGSSKARGECSPNAIWRLLTEYIDSLRSGALNFTAQRAHFFSRFDRQLRNFEKSKSVSFSDIREQETLNELCFLLSLAGKQDTVKSILGDQFTMKPLFYTDEDIFNQRQMMERGVDDAIAKVCETVNEHLAEVKSRMTIMAGSGLCEDNDKRFILESINQVSTVLQFCGFELITQPLKKALRGIDSWTSIFPEESELLEIANAILYIENTMLGFTSSSSVDKTDEASISEVAEQSVIDSSKQALYKEIQASITMSKRAIKDYGASNYDSKHIANLSQCFMTIAGGLNLAEQGMAAKLMSDCGDFITWLIRSELDLDREQLPVLADSLLAVDYLLKELMANRPLESALQKLITDTDDAIQSAMAV